MEWEFSILYALQEIHSPILDEIMLFVSSLADVGLFWLQLV